MKSPNILHGIGTIYHRRCGLSLSGVTSAYSADEPLRRRARSAECRSAKRRGSKRAKVALARKIGVILHRMWIDGTTYRWAEAKPIAGRPRIWLNWRWLN